MAKGKGWKVIINKSTNPRVREGANRGIALACENILGVSNQKAPIEEGTLIRSGTVSTDPANLRGAVSYDTPYAVKQHEDMSLRHDAGREAKYLENAFNETINESRQIIAREIRKDLL